VYQVLLVQLTPGQSKEHLKGTLQGHQAPNSLIYL